MKRLLILLAASALAVPAMAQHSGHMPGMKMPAPKAKPKPAAKPPARKAPAKARPAARRAPAKARPAARPAPKKAAPKPAPRRVAKPAPKPAAPAVDPHVGHDMGAMPVPTPPPTPVDPHAGHDMSNMPTPDRPADPMAGHDMSAMADQTPAPPVAPPPAAAFSGPAHAADLAFDPAVMAAARRNLQDEHGNIRTYKVLIDQLEAVVREGRDGFKWDGQAWYGGDIDKIWFKTEGEGASGREVDEAELQALWSHAIDPWFDLQAGVRYDFRPSPQRAHLVLGVQGLAPYWFELDGALFLSEKGDLTARFEGEYDLRLTQKLILQPRLEFDVALQDAPEIGVGSGVSSAELGARLRYEIRPEFAPYVGVEYQRAFGDTRDFRRAEGDDAGGWSLLLGVRTWF